MKSTQITTIAEIEPNGVYVFEMIRNEKQFYLLLTNLSNELHDLEGNKITFHDSDVVQGWRLETHQKATQIEVYVTFKNLCKAYLSAADTCEKFTPKDLVFEGSRWFMFAAKRANPKTIEKNRINFYEQQKAENDRIYYDLLNAKLQLRSQFDKINLPIIAAYQINCNL